MAAMNVHRRIEDTLICPITQQLPWDPVTAEDGYIYERSAIERHLATNARSPYTNQPIQTKLLPSPQLKSIIETLIENGTIRGYLAEQWKKSQHQHLLCHNKQTATNTILSSQRTINHG